MYFSLECNPNFEKKNAHFFFNFVLLFLNDNKKLFYIMATVVKKNQQQGYIITSRKSFPNQKEGKKHKFQHHKKGFKMPS